MHTRTLRTPADTAAWVAEVEQRGHFQWGSPEPDEYPCVVAWSFEDRSFRGYRDAIHSEFIYPRDFEP